MVIVEKYRNKNDENLEKSNDEITKNKQSI